MSKILLGSMLTAPDNHVLTYVLHSTAFLAQRIRSWRDVWNKHRMCDHSVRISRSTFPYISRESTPCTFLSGPTAVGSSWHCPDSLLRASSVVACFELRVACVSNLRQEGAKHRRCEQESRTHQGRQTAAVCSDVKNVPASAPRPSTGHRHPVKGATDQQSVDDAAHVQWHKVFSRARHAPCRPVQTSSRLSPSRLGQGCHRRRGQRAAETHPGRGVRHHLHRQPCCSEAVTSCWLDYSTTPEQLERPWFPCPSSERIPASYSTLRSALRGAASKDGNSTLSAQERARTLACPHVKRQDCPFRFL